MYYFLVIIAVAMFGGCFALNDEYRKLRSSNIDGSMESSFVGSLAGLIILFAVSRFEFDATPFTILIALLSALNCVGFVFFSFKALDSANLSLYSLFSMLGGMALPFFQGIVFYDEKLTVAKIICVLFIILSLCLTITKGKGKNASIYYIGVFVLNGMSGVLSKVFTSAPFETTSAECYSMWIAIFTAVISGIALFIISRKKKLPRYTFKAFGISAINGAMDRIANFLLVIALVHLDASIQYPLVTGGVIIISTLICFFGSNKPTKKEILSVVLAFIGMCALFIFE